MRTEPVAQATHSVSGQPGPETTRPRSLSEQDSRKLREACRDFEAIFLNQVLKSMRRTVIKSELFGETSEQELFREMMDSEIAKTISRTSSTGIADLLYRQLSAEIERNTPSPDGGGLGRGQERGENP